MTSSRGHHRTRTALWCAVAVTIASVFSEARQTPEGCTVRGRITSGATPLPGVSLVAAADGQVVGATSTEIDGRYELALPRGVYQLKVELTGFSTVERPVTIEGMPCTPQAGDMQLSLQPRGPRTATTATAPAPAGRGRFETLNVQTQDAAVVAAPPNADADGPDAAARLLLPPGFSTEATESMAVTGNMASLDRGMLGDRFDAIGRGEIDPVTGEVAPGFGPGGRRRPGIRRTGAAVAPTARVAAGRGGFMLGGRGGQQRTYNVQTNYTYGGSALDSAPYQLRSGNTTSDRSYNRQTFGVTVGGPVRLPGYDGDRRTNFIVIYNGNRGDQLFDQYATVPSAAMRTGDFSALPVPLIDPATGRAFAGNTIPAASLDPAALALLRFIPLPNLDGDSRNFRYTTTTDTVADNVNLRVTHNFTPAAGGRGAGGRGGGMGRPGRTRRTRQPGHERRHERAAPVPPQRQRTEQRLPDARRHDRRIHLQRAGRPQHHAPRHDAQRQPHVHALRSDAQGRYAFVEDVAGKRRDHRRLHRSRGLGRADAVVLEPVGRPRRHAEPAHGPAVHGGLHAGRSRAARTPSASAATSASTSPIRRPTPTRAAPSSSRASTRRADRWRPGAAASTSPTSCSACRSRPRCSTGRATCRWPDAR